MIGQVLGHYRILDELGAGGMGEVYLAEDTTLGRRVALKLLPAELARSPERLERFEREARTLAALDHPNIVTIHSVEEADGLRFLTMAYVEGETLGELIPPAGLPVERLLELAVSLAEGLGAAHERGIVHRDLKPGNVMVDGEGRLRILDFGLAKLEPQPTAGLSSQAATETLGAAMTREGSILGTYPYMSPEQAEGKAADGRSDLFSFGVVLYEMATGERPFAGETPASLISSILKDRPRPVAEFRPELPAELGEIVERCLAKAPAERFQTAAELRDALADLRARATAGLLSPGGGSARRRPRIAWTAGAVALTLAGLAVAALLLSGRFPSGEQEPQLQLTGRQSWQQITFFADSAVSPALSPDGRMLAFLRGPSTFFGPAEVHVKLLPDGDPVSLTRDGLLKMSPVFSPDGSRIAYTVVEQGGVWDTWVVPVFGGEARRWLANASGLVWTDHRRLLFSEIREVLQMGLVSALESRAESRWIYLPEHPRGMVHRSARSPDGRWVLAVEMETGAWLPCRLLPFDGNDTGRTVGPEGPCTHAAWSPDGASMYFSASAGDGYHLWRQRFPDGEPEQLTAGPTEEEGLALDPQGRSLLTSVGIRQSTVVIATAQGERPLSIEGYAWLDEIAHHGFPQPFSRDGSHLFFLRRRSTLGEADQVDFRHREVAERSGELWVVDVASGRAEPVLPGFEVRSYDLSPDDQVVVAEGLAADGEAAIWRARVDRREAPETLRLEGADSIRFAPDGGLFFRRSEPEGSFVWYRSPDGDETRRALDVPILDFAGISPDGRWLVALLPGDEGTFVLRAFPTSGGPPRVVCDACSLHWSPGGRFAYLLFPTGGAPVAAQGHTALVSLPAPGSLPELPEGGIAQAELSTLPNVVWRKDGLVFAGPDPETYAYSRATVQRNIFRVPLPP